VARGGLEYIAGLRPAVIEVADPLPTRAANDAG
jgi:hypothetical protein